ncbi:S8 family serine peptidase [Thermoproteota archaeon]
MKFLKLLFIFLVFFIPYTITAEDGFVKGELLIKVNPAVLTELKESNWRTSQILPELNALAIRSINPLAIYNKESRSFPVYKLKFDPYQNIHIAARKLRQNPNIVLVQPNYIYKEAFVPNDTYYSSQWNLEVLNMENAWDINMGSSEVVIAVIDSGVDWQHPDLDESIWTNPGEIPGNMFDDDGNGFIDDVRGWDFVDVPSASVYPGEDYTNPDNDPMDFHGHGTHVAGIACAETNNSTGIASVAPACKIMALRAGYEIPSGYGEFTTEFLIQALYYAAENGADIINLSLGGNRNYVASENLFEDAVNYALSQGLVVVAAAGNYASNIDSEQFVPAIYNGVIAVAATDSDNDTTYFSNFGNSIDLAAPGDYLRSTYSHHGIWGYSDMQGTSMSAPHVSAAAALIKSHSTAITSPNIYQILIQTAVDLGLPGHDTHFGYGLVNPYQALLAVCPPELDHSGLASADVGHAVTLSVTVSDNLGLSVPPSVSVTYKYAHTSTWQTQHMQHNSPVYTALIPASGIPTTLLYYFTGENPNISYPATLPPGAPGTFFETIIDDYSGPDIEFELIDYDYFNYDLLLTAYITDLTGVSPDSIVLTIYYNATSASYNISDSELSFAGDELTLDLTQLTPPGPGIDEIEFRIYAEDVSANASEKSLLLQPSTYADFLLFGPQGPGSKILSAPNPFNANDEQAAICFQVSQASDITITIYSLTLKQVIRIQREVSPGYHEIEWDGRDQSGVLVPNGVYAAVIKAESDGQKIVKRLKIAVLKE